MIASPRIFATLTDRERTEIATILRRRANEIAGYKGEHSCEGPRNSVPAEKQMPASVEYALELEIKRLRGLAEKVDPPQIVEDEE